MEGLLLLDWSFTCCVGKIEGSMEEEVMMELLLLMSEEVEGRMKQREVLGFEERAMLVVVP